MALSAKKRTRSRGHPAEIQAERLARLRRLRHLDNALRSVPAQVSDGDGCSGGYSHGIVFDPKPQRERKLFKVRPPDFSDHLRVAEWALRNLFNRLFNAFHQLNGKPFALALVPVRGLGNVGLGQLGEPDDQRGCGCLSLSRMRFFTSRHGSAVFLSLSNVASRSHTIRSVSLSTGGSLSGRVSVDMPSC